MGSYFTCCLLISVLFFFQAKAMQDPEIQNILTDPVMRQVTIETAYSFIFMFLVVTPILVGGFCLCCVYETNGYM